tara:strand:+ start:12015 stop:12275 length:261 start_codon:yes stop_codon:yes gene_type:complete
MAKIKEQSKTFRPFGTDLNKDKTLGESISPEGEPIGFYKGQQVDYDVVIDEMEERATRNQEGKRIKSRKLMFSGVDFKKLKHESEI